MTNTKKRVFTGILLTIFLFIITLGFFAFSNKKQGIARADSVDINYSFHSSDTYYIATFLPDNQVVPVMFTGDCSYTNSVLSTSFTLWLSYVGTGHTSVDYYTCNYMQQYRDSTMIATGTAGDSFVIEYNTYYTFYALGLSTDSLSIRFHVYAEDSFNSNVYSVSLGVDSNCPMFPSGLTGYKFFNIAYLCDNGSHLTYSFLVPTNFKYASRTYYLASSDSLTDNQLYNAGYQQGIMDNQQNVYNSGYSAGQTTGYNSGYSAGVANANNYSFIGLLGAVIDAPVNAFKSMFNFEILGVNLLDFLLGLFTIAVVITIIKYIKGGK